MLSDWQSNCKVAVWKIRSNSFVPKDHIEAYNCVLRVLGPLQEHVDVDVLDQIKLFLRALDIVILVCLLLKVILMCSILALGFWILCRLRVSFCFGIGLLCLLFTLRNSRFRLLAFTAIFGLIVTQTTLC